MKLQEAIAVAEASQRHGGAAEGQGGRSGVGAERLRARE